MFANMKVGTKLIAGFLGTCQEFCVARSGLVS